MGASLKTQSIGFVVCTQCIYLFSHSNVYTTEVDRSTSRFQETTQAPRRIEITMRFRMFKENKEINFQDARFVVGHGALCDNF